MGDDHSRFGACLPKRRESSTTERPRAQNTELERAVARAGRQGDRLHRRAQFRQLCGELHGEGLGTSTFRRSHDLEDPARPSLVASVQRSGRGTGPRSRYNRRTARPVRAWSATATAEIRRTAPSSMDLLAYFRVLKRRWLLILALTIVGGGLGYASTLLDSEAVKEPTFYKATSTLLLDPSNVSSFDQQFTNVEQVSILVTTGDVPNAVAQDLGTTETGRQLAERIVTLTNPTPSTLEITATDPDSDRSARLADAFADELVREHRRQGVGALHHGARRHHRASSRR